MKKSLTTAVMLLMSFAVFAGGAKEQEVTTITWWHSNAGVHNEATDALVENFNNTIGKENGILVEAIYQGKANDVLTKVNAVAQGGDKTAYPDIVQLDATGVINMSANPDTLYIEDLAESQGDNLDFLLDTAYESMKFGSKVIGIPFNASTILTYYNKDAYEEAGVEVPSTLDELIEIAPKLIKKDAKGNTIRYAVGNVPTTYELCSFIGSQNGVSYLTDNENGHLATPTKTLFKEDGTLAAFLEKWKALYATGGLVNQTSGVTGDFAAGNIATMFASTSNLTNVLEAIDGRFELGVAYLPKVNETATGGVNLSGGALFTFNKGEGKEAAIWTFIKYLTSAEAQLEWHIATGYLPVNEGTYELEEYKIHSEQNPLFKVASDQILESNPKVVGLWIPSAYQVYYSFQSNIRRMLEEDLPIEETVNKMANEIDGYLDDFRKQNIN